MSRQPTPLDAALERLYAAPYQAFTETRDALAKEARAAGQADLAAELKKERRPPVTVWAVNQLARRQPEAVRSLVASGERLRAAQARAVRGQGAGALRDETAEQRRLLAGLLKDALELVREAGSAGSADQQDRIEGTLLACANGPQELGDLLLSARLEKDLPRPGFGDLGGLSAFEPAPKGGRAREAKGREEEAPEERERLEEAERRAREAERALKGARQKRDWALESAQRAKAALEAATEAARRAEEVLDQAQAEAERAEAEAAEAEAERALAALRE